MASVLLFVVGFLCEKESVYMQFLTQRLLILILSTGEGTQQVTNTEETVLDRELELKDSVALIWSSTIINKSTSSSL